MENTVNGFIPEGLAKEHSECRARQQRIADVLADFSNLSDEPQELKKQITALIGKLLK